MLRYGPLAVCVVLLVLGDGRGHAQDNAGQPSASPGRVMDPDVVRVPSDSALARALAAEFEGKPARARWLAETALPEAPADQALQLRWVAARLAHAAGDEQAATKLLEPVVAEVGPLSAWGALRLAGWLDEKDPQRGLSLVDGLLARDDDWLNAWPGTPRARQLHAWLLSRVDRTDEAIEEFRTLLAVRPPTDAAPEVALPLAELLSARKAPEALVEALQLFRRVAYRAPVSKSGKHAMERAERLLAQFPPVVRKELSDPGPQLRVARADGLLAAYRYPEAQMAYAELQRRHPDDPQALCHARFGYARAMLKRRQRDKGAPLMAAVADECKFDPNERAWARYYAGRGFAAIGKNEQALEQYAHLEREAPQHRLADDALWRAAKVARDMDDEQGLLTRLSALPDRYPHGDMGGRARFALAWQLRSSGRVLEALSVLDAALAAGPGEDQEDVLGRAAYWRARCLSDLGRKREAVAAYAALISRWPLTYYGQQGRARLMALDPARANLLLQDLQPSEPQPLTFAHRPRFDTPAFSRALGLLRVGETAMAESELHGLHMLDPDAEPELSWFAAALFHRAGLHAAAVHRVRHHRAALLSRVPNGRDRALWRIAYPDAYAPLIERVARSQGVPPAFVRAVAREESGFNPRAVSGAGARGLIQLMRETAKAVAKGLKLPSDKAALHTPDVNLRIGTRFIATLARRYRGQYALVPAGYNAGPSAAGRWLKARQDQSLDEWVENIPYDETRHYTRRVLQTYGIYSWLSEGELPGLPLQLPAP